jgi:hypothetical protein
MEEIGAQNNSIKGDGKKAAAPYAGRYILIEHKKYEQKTAG